MSGGSFFIAVSPQYLMDLRPQMHLLTFFHHVAADAGPHCTGFPDAGTEKGSGASSSGRSERRNTRQPTYVAARCRSKRHPADLHLPAPWQGRRKEGWREGCGEPRSDDNEPSQVAALLPHSLLPAPSVHSRPLHSHHHVLYR